MTIRQQGGVFGRNPSFNDIEVSNDLDVLNDGYIAGDLGVGTQTPESFYGSKLVLKVGAEDGMTISTSGANQSSYILFNDQGTDAGWMQYTHASDQLVVTVGTAEAARFTSTGIAVPSGKGIDFSATSGTGTSELFDDYEEGTWTPVVAESSTGGTVGTGTFTGTYTKIGRMVTVNLILTNIATAGMTAGNILYVRGLPFTTGTGHLGSNMMRSVTYSGQIAPRTLDGQSYFYFYQYATGGAVTPLTIGGISSGVSDIWATVTYEV